MPSVRPNIYNQTADGEITILRSLLHPDSAPERTDRILEIRTGEPPKGPAISVSPTPRKLRCNWSLAHAAGSWMAEAQSVEARSA